MNSHELNEEETNKNVVRRIYQECLNEGKLEVAEQMIAPGFVSPGPDGGTGPEAFKTTASRLRNAFPDIHFNLQDLTAENDRVALRWTWEGTHLGAFMRFPPTGKRVRQEAQVMYRLAAGKIVSAVIQVDRLGFLQQLGVLPEIPGILGAPQPATA